jgi:hypothetical protein
MSKFTWLVACCCFLVPWVPEASADRALIANILLIDGRVELAAGTTDDGTASRDQVWQYLKRIVFRGSSGYLGGGLFRLVPDQGNPLQATLKGKIRVAIEYGGAAEATELRLVRKDRDSLDWRIHPDDVDALAGKRR